MTLKTNNKVKELDPYEIVERSVAKTGIETDPLRTYAALLEMIKQPNYRILRHNNSLLLIDNKFNGTADVMLFTADKQDRMVENIKEFLKALGVAGIKKITTVIPNLKFLEVLKKAKVDYKVENRGLNAFLITIVT